MRYTRQRSWWWTSNSFETCTARKNGGIKIIYKNCAFRWSLHIPHLKLTQSFISYVLWAQVLETVTVPRRPNFVSQSPCGKLSHQKGVLGTWTHYPCIQNPGIKAGDKHFTPNTTLAKQLPLPIGWAKMAGHDTQLMSTVSLCYRKSSPGHRPQSSNFNGNTVSCCPVHRYVWQDAAGGGG